jgi:arylsulfatase A-like enzyme
VSAYDLTPQWPEPLIGSERPPNVVVVVLDDVGFAQLGCYGSEIDTPNLDRLASGGLLYANFHSTAMCSPSRACLLTGRNHHSVGVGAISHYANGLPNNRGKIDAHAATLPEVLRSAGYATLAVGKWHLTPPEETNATGPFDGWPLGRGFERFYGFLDSMTDQWAPDLYQDNHRLDLQPHDSYHLSEDLTDKAVTMVREQSSLAADRPFFLYLAYGACHAPHQSPEPYRRKYRGRFDHGWDRARERVFARQKELGVIPEDTRLGPRNRGVPPWEDVPAGDREVFCREQEAFAAFLDHTDACIGRLVGELDSLGILDSTVVVVVSDNGAAGDAGESGTLNELRIANVAPPGPSETEIDLDEVGGPLTWNNYARGWAMVGNTPLRWYKRNVYGGGARVPFIIRCPERIRARGVRRQFHHVNDLMPTILEIADIDAPDTFEGRVQIPIHGTSMGYSFDDADVPSRHDVQYFEMLGDRGIYHRGWKAVTLHESGSSYDADDWELFNLDADFSESEDLAARFPDKLKELTELWWSEAASMGVLPLDDRQGERNLLMPPWIADKVTWTFYPGMAPVTADCLPLLDRSYEFVATVDIPAAGAEGVLLAVGGRFGGSALFVKDASLIHDYNAFGDHLVLESSEPITPGRHVLSFHLERAAHDAGVGELRIDGRAVGRQTLTKMLTHWMGPEPVTVGRDGMTPVSSLYEPPYPFTGSIHHVQCNVAPAAATPNPEAYAACLERQ